MPDDSLASQRVELLGQLVVAQFDIEAAIVELGRGSADSGPLRAQLQNLTALQRQVGTASSATLATLRHDVIAAVAQSQTVAQEARAHSDAVASIAETVSLSSLAATSRAQVDTIMRDMHRFDDELVFDSPQDQAAYRQREDDRRAYVEQEQRKHTPQGDLNAAGGAVGQMADARAHGASSPEFEQRWNELVATTGQMRTAIFREGGDVSQFDARLRDDFRRILKSKGLSDAQLDARFAAHPNPLEAARAVVHNDADVAVLERSAERVRSMGQSTNVEAQDDVKNAIAALQTSGVVTSRHDSAALPDHGVAAVPVKGAVRLV